MRSISLMGCVLVLMLIGACAGERNDASSPSTLGSADVEEPVTPTPSSAPSAVVPSPPVPSAAPPTPDAHFDSSLKAHAALTFDCASDTDCAIKDVGNCCGSYPACVSADSPVDAAAVARECADKNVAGICGFPVIEACVCSAGRCEAAPSKGIGEGAVR